VRFWTAAALCRFSTAVPTIQSGRGLPQSKTLARRSFPQHFIPGYGIFENALSNGFLTTNHTKDTKKAD
jgi:hypothetical protein